MSSGAQQLAADFEQVKKQLSLYPGINILETEGNPPDRYDIEYKIKGYSINDDGTAAPANIHKIRVTFPFGYPHFPPVAKPLTPIFHPDIDPDAIRIADFWQKNKSLAELIVHIGRMICGMHYHSEEPFNQEAYVWYGEHRDLLPFDTLEPAAPEQEKVSGNAAAHSPGESIVSEESTGEKLSASDESPAIIMEDLTLPFDDEPEDADIDIFAGDEESDEDDLTFTLDLENDEESWTVITGDEDTIDLTDDEEFPPPPHGEDALEEFFGEEDINLEDLGGTDEDVPSSNSTIEREENPGIFLDLEEIFEEQTAGGKEQPLTVEEEESGAGETEKSEKVNISPELETESAPPDDPDKNGDETTTVEDESLAKLELDDGIREERTSGTESGKCRSIRPLIEEKKIFTAKKIIADVMDPGSIPDLEELEQDIAGAIARAENLFKKADKLEQAGEYEKAGLTLDQVANVTVDYPGLDFARNRIRDSLLAKDSQPEPKASAGKRADAKKWKKKKARSGSGFTIPYKIIAIVVLLTGILAAATLMTIKDSNRIKLASSNFQQAENFLANKEFKHAENMLAEAAAALNQILVLQKKKKVELQQKIIAITDSQGFKEGLQGRVLYDGRYVTVDMARDIDKLNALMINAETWKNSGNIEEALKFYDQAGETTARIGFTEQEQTIRQIMNTLRLKKALGEARKAEEEKEWKQAADIYGKALELSSNFSTADDKNEIASRFASASFRHDLMEGQRAFTSSDWQTTIEMLQRAGKILENNPHIASEAEKEEIYKLLVYSRLYHILSGARNAYEKKEFELAVDEYKNAIYLLENNKNALGDKAEAGINKIEKTILMTEIAREQSRHSEAAENNNLQQSLQSYRAIASLLKNSSFREDDTLIKIAEDAGRQIVVMEYEIKIKSRVDWLRENYEKVFREMYPSASSSELLNPEVSFVREEGDKLLFTMSCVEKRQGSSFRLELNYQYDQNKKTWDFYSGTL
ncbi:MAG: hypothetical protein SCH71_08465 [Desulfobulbaceae bacterium]|nr:hypothetical protein [Desulfobulbaceae bacterium]